MVEDDLIEVGGVGLRKLAFCKSKASGLGVVVVVRAWTGGEVTRYLPRFPYNLIWDGRSTGPELLMPGDDEDRVSMFMLNCLSKSEAMMDGTLRLPAEATGGLLTSFVLLVASDGNVCLVKVGI